MYILPQLLKISSKNLLVNHLILSFKDKLHNVLNNISYDTSKNIYLNIFIQFQSLMNDLCLEFFTKLFELLDLEFKYSIERKDKYFINKSNVERTLITIFGTINFKRTLYQHKLTHEYYFYLDDILHLESYKSYDPLIRAILLEDSVLSNPNLNSKFSSLRILNLKSYLKNSFLIPKQTIYKFKQEVKLRKINYDEISHDKTLYVMVDEKWIHEQDKNNPNYKKWIMSKCFVTFTGIERKGKRSRLLGRHIFITTSSEPWKEFMNEIWKIYNFEKLENINLLSDAGSWILSGAYELKLFSNNKVKINTCEFHVKQKINRSTTDKELRTTIANLIYEKEDKKSFIKEMDKLINSKTKESRKQKITEYKNYILKHWKGILNMKHSLCKSSMESHIEHCIASSFSSIPKAYSKNHIETYLKLQEMFLNDISIIDYFFNTYNSNDNFVYNNENEVDFSFFDKSTSNMPILNAKSSISHAFHNLAYS